MSICKRQLCSCILIILSLALASCAGVGLQFDRQLLQQGGVIIGGISAVDTQLTERQRLLYADVIKQAFRQHHPETELIDAAQVYRSIGRSMYGQMQDSYRFSGTASFALMDVVRARFPTQRYIVYARIEREQLNKSYQQLENGQGYELFNSRVMMVSMRIFDLEQRQSQVWAAGLQDVATRKRQVFGRHTEEKLATMFSDPPPSKEVLVKVIDGLVRNIDG